jgi:hypothetical protein
MNLPAENSCTHEFTQIGQQFIMPCGWNYGGVQGQMPASTAYQRNVIIKPYLCKVTVHNCFIQPLRSVMQCYNLLDSAIKTVRNYYNTHIDIWLTQWIKFENLPAAPIISGLNTLITTSLWNITDIIILFPRTGDDYTIYKNIMYENIILKVGNRKYIISLLQVLELYS